jgi:hypothetical protein
MPERRRCRLLPVRDGIVNALVEPPGVSGSSVVNAAARTRPTFEAVNHQPEHFTATLSRCTTAAAA